MNNDFLQYFMTFAKGFNNPQEAVMSMLKQQNNPFFNNLLELAQSNNSAGIEQIARNIMKERGLDFDTEFNNFRQMLGF